MSECLFKGGAPSVAQVNNVTPANVEIGDVFTIKLENSAGEAHTLSYTAAAATVQDVVEGLQALAVAAKAASTAPWDEVTATEDDTKLILTADTAGVPFYVTASATNGGAADTQTFTDSTATACSGPGIITVAENYYGGVAPVSGDSIVLDCGSQVIYGTDLTAVTLVGFKRTAGCSGAVGSNAHPLQINLKNGAYYNFEWNGTGTGDIELNDWGTALINGAANASAGSYGLNITGACDANAAAGVGKIVINCTSGQKVGLAAYDGNTLEVNDIRVAGGNVTIGTITDYNSGATTTLLVSNADDAVELHSTVASSTIYGGILRQKAGTSTAAYAYGGTFYYSSPTTLPAATVKYSGILDFSEDLRTKTVSALTLYRDGSVRDPYGILTITAFTKGEGGSLSLATT